MARLIKRLRREPFEVKIGGETQYICGCGLSKNQPFCDGTHKTTRNETVGCIYWYDSEGVRHQLTDLAEKFPDIRHE